MKLVRCLLVACLVLVGLGLRVPTVEQGLLGDERVWLDRAQDLLEQVPAIGPVPGYEPGNDLADRRCVEYEDRRATVTIRSHHPGYAAAILVAAGMRLLLPEHPGIEDLVRVRWVQSVFYLAAVLLSLWLLVGVLGVGFAPALLFGTYLLTEPMILGESRLIKQDALLLSLILLGILQFLAFLHGSRRAWLVGAGLMMGLACATKMVALLHLLVMVGFLVADPRSRNRSMLGRLLLPSYLAFMVASPPLWLHPIRGPFDALAVAAASSQVRLPDIGVLDNAWYFLRTFTHLSPLFVLVVIAAVSFPLRKRTREDAYLAATAVVSLGVLFFSSVKTARYVFPVVPVTLLLAMRWLEISGLVTRNRVVAVALAGVVALHGYSFVWYFPYHSVYTWERFGASIEFPHERLTRTILLPEIGEDLDRRGIESVDVLTGHQNLTYYYRGTARPFEDWDAPWILVAQKYFHRIPEGLGPPVTTYTFRNQEIYRLFRGVRRSG